jgi:hypothetical protein
MILNKILEIILIHSSKKVKGVGHFIRNKPLHLAARVVFVD